MAFRVFVDEDAYAFLNLLDPKSRRIIGDCLNVLKEDSYPGSGGDEEKLQTSKNRNIYQMHIARSFTAIYAIDPQNKTVHITHVMEIEKMH
ncbi:hypothetical protein [Methanoculleus bourgensis]|uniref:hypothetical protein n=1 Tax=Methanoculleus bourgensis TaxID=83986 RepID=UPI0022EF31CE|nr:hypothetical protein [Methanoculleus bourgensis]GLI45430.1 hypothetical protein MBOURGENBZM_02220 [Methanoculleus bourgensis]